MFDLKRGTVGLRITKSFPKFGRPADAEPSRKNSNRKKTSRGRQEPDEGAAKIVPGT
jgi:hypothetical protein